MNKAIYFSIVIPLYNKEHSIVDTLQSVLTQSFQNFEVVVVNDGSTDNSIAAVQKLKDSRIRLINKPNQGVSCARNVGIANSKNEWIAFLDGDDLWMPYHLEEIVKMMNARPEGKMFVTSFKCSTGESMQGNVNLGPIYCIQNFFKEYLNSKNLVWTSTVVVNKACLLEVDGFNHLYSLGEDLDLWARLSKNYFFIKSNKITAIYRLEAENRSNKGKYNMDKSFLSRLDFSKMATKEEKAFYKFWIIHKMKGFALAYDFSNLLFLVRKYALRILFV